MTEPKDEDKTRIINYRALVDALKRRGDPLSLLAADAIHTLLHTIAKMIKEY